MRARGAIDRGEYMKKIQWFPGHMTKAMREMEEQKKLADGVIVVLDARAPAASLNKNLKNIFGEKPILYVLNKADLADPKKTEGFLRLIESKGRMAVKACGTSQNFKRFLFAKIEQMVREKRERAEAKGINRSFHFMVAGIPNTGKSTVINLLSGVKKAETGDKAGVTRQVRWIRCSSFDLLDTPGTMPPSCEDQTLAKHLAYIGCINDAILDMDDIVLELLKELSVLYPERLAERYGIEDREMPPLSMLETVCRRRGFLMKGGKEFDYEKGIRAVIDDLRKGRLGQIGFENADDYADLEF